MLPLACDKSAAVFEPTPDPSQREGRLDRTEAVAREGVWVDNMLWEVPRAGAGAMADRPCGNHGRHNGASLFFDV